MLGITREQTLTHLHGSHASYLRIEEESNPTIDQAAASGRKPSRTVHFILSGAKEASWGELLRLAETIAGRLGERYLQLQREALPPARSPSMPMNPTEQPVPWVWEVDEHTVISLTPPIVEPRLVLEVYQAARERGAAAGHGSSSSSDRDSDHDGNADEPAAVEPTERLLASIDQLMRQLDQPTADNTHHAHPHAETLADRVRALAPEAQTRARGTLTRAWEATCRWLARVPIDRAAWPMRLYERLEQARTTALAAIRDEAGYRKQGNQHVIGHQTVEAAVARVRTLWRRPSVAVVAAGPALERRLANVRWLGSLLALLEDEPRAAEHTEAAIAALHTRFNAALRLDVNPPTAAARQLAARVRATRAANDADPEANGVEREYAHQLNDYRHMLGLEPLRLAAPLTRAARAHSAYMSASGRFGHVLPGHPHGTTPARRAAAFGYRGAVSENLAMRGRGHRPETAFRAWCRSPDHHRNMINERWRHLGVGVSEDGRYWTTKFGQP